MALRSSAAAVFERLASDGAGAGTPGLTIEGTRSSYWWLVFSLDLSQLDPVAEADLTETIAQIDETKAEIKEHINAERILVLHHYRKTETSKTVMHLAQATANFKILKLREIHDAPRIHGRAILLRLLCNHYVEAAGPDRDFACFEPAKSFHAQ